VFRAGNNAFRRVAGPVAAGQAGDLRARPTLRAMVRDAQPPSQERPRGAALGLPAEGPGSLAPFGTRIGAFLVDAVAAALIAGLFTAPSLPGNWSLLPFGLITVVTLVAFGQTPGMRLLGLRLAHPRAGQPLALWRAVVRTALLMVLVPALVVDADGRGLHDRLTDTAVVRDA
jgi:RDD family